MNDQKTIRQLENERRRGMFVYLLYLARPKPIDIATLMMLLDRKDVPVSFRRMAEELDFLCGKGLIRVFPIDANKDLDCVEQAKLVQKYLDSDGDLGDGIYIRIRNKGIEFQEGYEEVRGVRRVN